MANLTPLLYPFYYSLLPIIYLLFYSLSILSALFPFCLCYPHYTLSSIQCFTLYLVLSCQGFIEVSLFFLPQPLHYTIPCRVMCECPAVKSYAQSLHHQIDSNSSALQWMSSRWDYGLGLLFEVQSTIYFKHAMSGLKPRFSFSHFTAISSFWRSFSRHTLHITPQWWCAAFQRRSQFELAKHINYINHGVLREWEFPYKIIIW